MTLTRVSRKRDSGAPGNGGEFTRRGNAEADASLAFVNPATIDSQMGRPEIDAELVLAKRDAVDARHRVAALGAAGVTATAREMFPTAATLILSNKFESFGPPGYVVLEVQDARGVALWNFDEGEDEPSAEFANYAILLNDLEEPLEQVDRETWKLTLPPQQ